LATRDTIADDSVSKEITLYSVPRTLVGSCLFRSCALWSSARPFCRNKGSQFQLRTSMCAPSQRDKLPEAQIVASLSPRFTSLEWTSKHGLRRARTPWLQLTGTTAGRSILALLLVDLSATFCTADKDRRYLLAFSLQLYVQLTRFSFNRSINRKARLRTSQEAVAVQKKSTGTASRRLLLDFLAFVGVIAMKSTVPHPTVLSRTGLCIRKD
jgi:hypothetical protein